MFWSYIYKDLTRSQKHILKEEIKALTWCIASTVRCSTSMFGWGKNSWYMCFIVSGHAGGWFHVNAGNPLSPPNVVFLLHRRDIVSVSFMWTSGRKVDHTSEGLFITNMQFVVVYEVGVKCSGLGNMICVGFKFYDN
jgi:hypothetical protein